MKKAVLVLLLFVSLACKLFSEERLYKVWADTVDRHCGFINRNGELVIPADYEYVDDFSEGLAAVSTRNGKSVYINQKNKVVIDPDCEDCSAFSEGLAVVTKREGNSSLTGVINKRGKVVIPFYWDYIDDFSEGKSFARKDGRTFCINKKGKVLYELNAYESDRIKTGQYENGYVYVCYIWEPDSLSEKAKSVEMLLDAGGKQCEKPDSLLSPAEKEYYSFIDKETGKTGLKNKSGEIVIPAKYDFLYEPDEKGYILFGFGEYEKIAIFGYMNIEEEIIIPCEFHLLEKFNGDLARFCSGRSYGGYVTRDGHVFYDYEYLINP